MRSTFPCPVCKGKYLLEGDDVYEPCIYCTWCDEGFMTIDGEKHRNYALGVWLEKAPAFLFEPEDCSPREGLNNAIKFLDKEDEEYKKRTNS